MRETHSHKGIYSITQWLCVHICEYIIGGSEGRKSLKTNVFVYDYLDILLYCLDTSYNYILQEYYFRKIFLLILKNVIKIVMLFY